jgi:hypothetical protein
MVTMGAPTLLGVAQKHCLVFLLVSAWLGKALCDQWMQYSTSACHLRSSAAHSFSTPQIASKPSLHAEFEDETNQYQSTASLGGEPDSQSGQQALLCFDMP